MPTRCWPSSSARACAPRSDLRNEKINYKVREHSLAKVPVMLVVGKREADEGKVSIRRLGSQDQTVMSLDEALATLTAEAVPPDLRRAQGMAPSGGVARSIIFFVSPESAARGYPGSLPAGKGP